MFGKGFSCNDCVFYAGNLSDGKPMCMKRGPLMDIICCPKFQKQGTNRAPASRKNTGKKCVWCRYFRSQKEKHILSAGECMKFPGRVYDGEKRYGCAFYENV